MSSTSAERQRRHRAHKAGDHRLCLVGNCDQAGVADPVTGVTAPVTRGSQLWQDMGGDQLGPAQRTLLEEACRIVDRLDKLDHLLSGSAEDWIGLVEDKGFSRRQIVTIDRPLVEARQQAIALKQLVAEIRAAGAVASAKPVVGDRGAADVTDLTTWVPTRSTRPAG